MTKQSTLFGLKVDIDTYEGGLKGIPNLVNLFKKHAVPATFFAVMGPDHSGRAAFRVFTHKGFLKKMLRTKAPSVYGFKTLLYGTLLPGPVMPEKLKDQYRMIMDEGFELGMHGFDHIDWHNNLTRWPASKIKSEYEKMIIAFQKATGVKPLSVGTPGWQESEDHIRVTDSLGFQYRSDMRFSQPFLPKAGEYISSRLEIPTTFPSLDEVLGNEDVLNGKSPADVMMEKLQPRKVNIFTLHTELEGQIYIQFLEDFIIKLKETENMEFLDLRSIAKRVLDEGHVPVKEFRMGEVPGRAGLVAVAGEEVMPEQT